MVNTAIRLQGVEFSWKTRTQVLSVDDFTVSQGERVFLQGASGSGKSTLLSLIGGVITPQKGRVELLGEPFSNWPADRRDRFRAEHIGFIFQMFNLIPYLTVLANVLLPLQFASERWKRLTGADPVDEARRLLAALGLTDEALINRSVTELSIGQQQRVAAARALLGHPRIVIADEPTSALDADARADFLRLLMSECAAHGTTLLFVSHDSALGSQFDRTVRISDINSVTRKAA